MTLDATGYILYGIILHLIADWLFQTEWMALNKWNLKHPASWVHSGIHSAFNLLIFPWYVAVPIGFSHLLIDTRKPLIWWIRVVKSMEPSSPSYPMVQIWVDQVFHIVAITLIVLLLLR